MRRGLDTCGRLSGVVRDYLPDRVYGANDGIITTFAVAAAAHSIGALRRR